MSSRITTPDEALAHPNRVRALATVAQHPGIGFRGLVRRTGIPTGTLRHHLNVLGRCGLLQIEKDGRVLRHFPADLSAPARLAAVLERDGLADLYAFVAVHGPVMQKHVLDVTPGPRSTAQSRLNRLVRRGFVQAQPSGRRIMYKALEATA